MEIPRSRGVLDSPAIAGNDTEGVGAEPDKTSQGNRWTVFIQRVNFSSRTKKNAGSEAWLS
jgi:hypothetical protein